MSLISDETKTDYARLIAAQSESARRLEIKKIIHTLSEEQQKKNRYAIASGVFLSGLIVATCFSGVDINQAIQTEIAALNSFDALKEYLAKFTPAMLLTTIGTAVSYSRYIKHNNKYKRANQQLDDMSDTYPTKYLDIVEKQAKTR